MRLGRLALGVYLVRRFEVSDMEGGLVKNVVLIAGNW